MVGWTSIESWGSIELELDEELELVRSPLRPANQEPPVRAERRVT
jgi:hypothetical protein